MPYVNCLHCSKSFAEPSTRRYCSALCKNAVDKHLAKLKLADDRYHETTRRTATYHLTDVECFKIEAAVASQEQHVFDGNGWRVTDARDETNYAATDGLRESWADKGAELDIWAIRRLDRERFGGIVLTPELAAEMEWSITSISTEAVIEWAFQFDFDKPDRVFDGLDSPEFHNKLFGFELDEIYELETGEKA